ncbi:hypothetical protein DRN74_03460 [Candidatus Micrarchaeota archaeon]|nr:MAG: hypothetical protein DRN74_03460 [Candidatus Micrarchaeota archaeon]
MQENEDRIVCLGSATVDMTVKSKEFRSIKSKGKTFIAIEEGTKHNAESIVIHPGGSACNIASALSKLGENTYVISRVGDDVYGNIIINHLKELNVDTTYLKRTIGVNTAASINLVGYENEKTLVIDRGALNHINPQDVPDTFIKHSKAVVITSMTSLTAANAALKAGRICRENNNYLALAPSISMIKEKARTLLNLMKYSNTLILNEEEISALMGEKNMKKAMEKAASMGPKTVVVLRGTKGSAAYVDGKYYEHRAYRVKVADTTGAGDAYAAGFIYGELHSQNIEESMDLGAKLSAMVITKAGAQEGIPNLYQLKRFKARFI